jgi:hypothetical protein
MCKDQRQIYEKTNVARRVMFLGLLSAESRLAQAFTTILLSANIFQSEQCDEREIITCHAPIFIREWL